MAQSNELQVTEGALDVVVHEGAHVRRVFHDEEWFFSVVDVVAALTGSGSPSRYWTQLRDKIDREGSQLFDGIEKLRMPGADGRSRGTDAANTETIFRIIQSIPSPRAEPFKRWLARVGYERLQETENPGIAVDRGVEAFRDQGRDEEWINARVKSKLVRLELTNEWQSRGVRGKEYGVLTDTISRETFDLSIRQHKAVKGLTPKSSALRDHMNTLELVLTMFGEASTTSITRARDARGFLENRDAAERGGKVAGEARRRLEDELGRPVVTEGKELSPDGQPPTLPA